MHDGIELELRGIPAAVICTRPFENMGRATARIRGIPDYPFVLAGHPIGRIDAGELEARVQEVLAGVESLLLRGSLE